MKNGKEMLMLKKKSAIGREEESGADGEEGGLQKDAMPVHAREEIKSPIIFEDADLPSKIAEPGSSTSIPSTSQSPHSSRNCHNSSPSSPESTPRKMQSLTDIYDACNCDFALMLLNHRSLKKL
ncbi:hypothetical protein LWI29_005953 [Acer saccharum]|uniref:Uncharacterized protein n=1 Tax=Acer saccharum TaxID=4024 RepID=A0AA39RCA7_ACESA|nr:hypothetical protein LWI29_005953 [Acer saccharum]